MPTGNRQNSKHTPGQSINPINQLITSPGEADKIVEAAQREADNIMAIAFPSGAEPLLATNDTITTQTAHSVPPTAPTATTAATAADHLDQRKAAETSITIIHDECNPGQLARNNSEPPAHSQHRT